MRYAGQGYELRVSLAPTLMLPRSPGSEGSGSGLDAKALAAVRARFDDLHARIHGHAAKEKSVEVVSYRQRVRVAVPKFAPHIQEARPPAPPSSDAVKGARRVFFTARDAMEAMIYDRECLAVGAEFAGPAIVEQFDATTVVPPGWHASVDRYGNLILERKG
jgi:N-methylhydantoinase A